MSQLIELKEEQQDASWAATERSGTLSLISAFNLCYAVDAARRVGLTSYLVEHQSIEITIDPGCQLGDPHLLSHLLQYFAIHGLLVASNEGYKLTSRGKELFSNVSLAQIGFYVEAYGPVVSRLDALITRKATYGLDVLRDGGALGEHCATLFGEYHTDTVLRALTEIDATTILDVGCGAGQFLIDACLRSPRLKGIGLDISAPAIKRAQEAAADLKVADRIQFLVGDAFDIDSWPAECTSADVLTAVGVLHEHFRDGRDAVISILNEYNKLFAKGLKAFILGEPELRYDLVKNDADLYLVHIFTAQGFPHDRESWLHVIGQSELSCSKVFCRPNAGPRFNFFQLIPSDSATIGRRLKDNRAPHQERF
ncbi:class I SAM-dependent methyltransferase [Bradyrhizobium sp. CCBAU 11386]|uniref:class I SAM-dependent methyltransferase n=1 Tax=Bradyrhizobium sp. CCBAU 11386 TaxID=1630837 RepID=UPI002301FEA9|nr:class I SAM-dependent methyltransferase [Bradyrhizobium sp. CCBAU 11386]